MVWRRLLLEVLLLNASPLCRARRALQHVLRYMQAVCVILFYATIDVSFLLDL